jgi:hypothetical protein
MKNKNDTKQTSTTNKAASFIPINSVFIGRKRSTASTLQWLDVKLRSWTLRNGTIVKRVDWIAKARLSCLISLAFGAVVLIDKGGKVEAVNPSEIELKDLLEKLLE